MPKHGKNYRTAAEKYEKLKLYSLQEAVELVKDSAYANFDETVDIAMRLNVDPRH
ncbi:50S ribosomal protein L1, partial [bacterium]